LEVFAQGFDVFDKMPGGIVGGIGVGLRPATTTLVKEDYAILLRVKEGCICL
jgi:hypothetical protein